MRGVPAILTHSTKMAVDCNDIMDCGSFSPVSGHAINHDAFICESIELLQHELAGLRVL